MDTTETQETTAKDGRVRAGDIAIQIQLSFGDLKAISQLQLKKMKQFGKDVARDVIISEAIQHHAKGFGGQE